MQGTDQSRDAIQVVAMKMAYENAVNPAAFHARPHELYLSSFAAVEQKHVALTHESGG
jgi:hypothetical protein